MGTNAVNLGVGNAAGYFFHAPKGTALPASPLAELSEAWKEVGYVAQEGITWHNGRTATPLKDWANKIRRQLQEDSTGTVEVPIITTDAEVLKTLFGEENVVVTAANADHGNLVSIDVEEGVVSDEEAFLFLMKDGDDAMMLGTTNGLITDVADVNFAAADAITWNGTISADKWRFVKDDGQVVSGN